MSMQMLPSVSVWMTYCLHAVLWALAVRLLVRPPGLSPTALQRLWRLALLGPLGSTVLCFVVPTAWGQALSPAVATLVEAPQALRWPERLMPTSRGWEARLESALHLALAFGLLRFAWSATRLVRALRSRRPVRDERMQRIFASVRSHSTQKRSRLVEASTLGAALVIGRNEICVDVNALARLTDEEVAAVLAHELAHLEHRHGLWFPWVRCVEQVLWLQPLNAWVARRYRACAEVACDDRAVEMTRNAYALARALTHLAEQAVGRRANLLLPAMAHIQVLRVRRLVQKDADTAACAVASPCCAPSRWHVAVIAGLALATAHMRVEYGRVAVGGMSGPVESLAPAVSGPLPTRVLPNSAVDALSMRERQIAIELSELAASQQSSTLEAVRLLELEQELHHVQQERAWLETNSAEAHETTHVASPGPGAARKP